MNTLFEKKMSLHNAHSLFAERHYLVTPNGGLSMTRYSRKILFTLILLLLASFLVNCSSMAYNNAKQQNTKEAYEDYLMKYPDSPQAAEVLAKLDEINYHDATFAQSTEMLEEFIKKHPNSKYASEIKVKLEEYKYKEAMRNRETAEYKTFLTQYPKSEHAPEIRQLYEENFWNETLAKNSVEGYREFMKILPDSENAPRAQQKIDALQGRGSTATSPTNAAGQPAGMNSYSTASTKERLENVAYQNAQVEDSLQAYSYFLSKFPQSRQARVAQNRMEYLQIADQNNISALERFTPGNSADRNELQDKIKLLKLRQSTWLDKVGIVFNIRNINSKNGDALNGKIVGDMFTILSEKLAQHKLIATRVKTMTTPGFKAYLVVNYNEQSGASYGSGEDAIKGTDITAGMSLYYAGAREPIWATGVTGTNKERETDKAAEDLRWSAWQIFSQNLKNWRLPYTPSWKTQEAIRGSIAETASGNYEIDGRDRFWSEVGSKDDSTIIANRYVYYTASDTIRVVDISDRRDPRQIKEMKFSTDYINKLLLQDNWLYVASGKDGLKVINIQNPEQPVEQTSVSVRFSGGMALHENYLYLAAWEDGLKVFDISTPQTPREVATVSLDGPVKDVEILNGYAYASIDEFGIKVLNLAKETKPSIVGGYAESELDSFKVLENGELCLLTSSDTPTIKILSVKNPKNIQLITHYKSAEFRKPTAFFALQNYIYITSVEQAGYQHSDLKILNIKDRRRPEIMGAVPLKGVETLSVSAGYAYGAGSAFYVVDISIFR
jgi:outer membrane protein assembly factor BamD (BamD/ComL family)